MFVFRRAVTTTELLDIFVGYDSTDVTSGLERNSDFGIKLQVCSDGTVVSPGTGCEKNLKLGSY